MNQIKAMIKCDCCGHPVQHRQSLGKSKICRRCFGKIDTSAWRKTDYEDNEEVENNRQKMMNVAAKNNFPQMVIDDINVHFDRKIQKGLLCVLKSDCGQRLKIYEDYTLLITMDDFDKETISKAYGKAIKKNQPKEKLLSNDTAKTLARNVLHGGIVKAGISLATSVAIDVAADKIIFPQGQFKVVNGSFKIDYHIFNYVEYQRCGDNEIGFIRFVNSRGHGQQAEDIIFFFENDSKKIDDAYQLICSRIEQAEELRVNAQKKVMSTKQFQPPLTAQIFVADEIMKFKELLDVGAITKDEFDAKKKELLELSCRNG